MTTERIALKAGNGLTVRTLVGAQYAYACISHQRGTMDVRLEPGRSASESLLQTAAELEAKAERLTKRAELMRRAAEVI